MGDFDIRDDASSYSNLFGFLGAPLDLVGASDANKLVLHRGCGRSLFGRLSGFGGAVRGLWYQSIFLRSFYHIFGPIKNSLGLNRVRVAYTAGEAIGPEIFEFYSKKVFTTPWLRIISRIANVRIRRFVQNGIVTKNSHMFRVSGGRVAMKYAVGKPRTNAVSVVKKDNRTDRQRIDRCASAIETVSSNISL